MSYKIFTKRNNPSFKDHDIIVGMDEQQGRRLTQEDKVLAFVLDGFENLSVEGREKLLRETLDSMQQFHGREEAIGSTVCGVIAWRVKNIISVCTTNLGDSVAFLIIIDRHGKPVIQRLNKRLHNPATEYKRITEQTNIHPVHSDYSLIWRLPHPLNHTEGYLSVSRAIGDTIFESTGLIHDAEFYSDQKTLAQDSKAFVVVACDGLTEDDHVSEKDIAQLVAKNRALSPSKIARLLGDVAFNLGSQDNISVAVFSIDAELPTAAFIFDGHGDVKVSRALSEYFYPNLYFNLQKIKFIQRSSDSGAGQESIADLQQNQIKSSVDFIIQMDALREEKQISPADRKIIQERLSFLNQKLLQKQLLEQSALMAYLDMCISSKKKDKLATILENYIVDEQYPELKDMKSYKPHLIDVQNTQRNRILNWIGDNHPEMIENVLDSFLAIINRLEQQREQKPQPKKIATKDKKEFINYVNLLEKLGDKGHLYVCQLFGRSSDIKRKIAEDTIASYLTKKFPILLENASQLIESRKLLA